MNLGCFGGESWQSLNNQIRKDLSFLPENSLYTFLGVGHAVSELTDSLAHLYDHKMSVAVINGVGPAVEPLSVHFSRKGLNVQRASIEDSDLMEWAKGLKKDTLFVCLEEDHPISGELFDHSDLIEIFNERKIFHITVSYNSHFSRGVEDLSPYEIRVCGLAPSRALAFLGQRVKFHPYVSQQLDWREIDKNSFIFTDWDKTEKRVIIEDFEKQNVTGMKPFFKKQVNRLYDRAVVFWENLDGAALQSRLNESLKIAGAPAGYNSLIETTSLCRWQQAQFWNWFSSQLSPTEVRGLMVFDQSILGQNFTEVLQGAVEYIYSLQAE